jgi:hypothetical protein
MLYEEVAVTALFEQSIVHGLVLSSPLTRSTSPLSCATPIVSLP